MTEQEDRGSSLGTGGARRAVGDMGLQAVGRIANMLLGVVVVVVITRELGPARFGEWATVLAICQVAGYVGELGLEPALVRRVAARRGADEAVSLGALLALRLLLSLPAAVVSVLAIMVVASSREMLLAGALASAGVLVSALSALRVVYQLRLRNDVPIAVMTVNSVLWTGAVVVLAADGRGGLVAFAAALLAAQVVTAALQAWLALRRAPIRFAGSAPAARELLRVGVVLGIGQLLVFAYVRIDQALVLHLVGEQQAGLYAAAYQLLDRAQFVPVVVLTTLLPLLAAADPDRLVRLVARGTELIALVSLPVLAFALVAAEPFLVLLFGIEFAGAAPALPILMGLFVLSSLGYLQGNTALVLGTQVRNVAVNVLALGFNVAVNVALLPSLGFLVAAWTALATQVLVLALAWPFTFGRLPRRLPLGRVPRIVAASAVMALAVGGLVALEVAVGWLLAAAVVVYAVAVPLLRAVDLDEVRALVGRTG